MREEDKKLIEKNMYVVKCVVSSMFKKYRIPYDEYEDYCQMGYLMLCDKVHKYDGSVKFNTFADKVLKNGFIDLYRKKHDICCVSLDDIDGSSFINYIKNSGRFENESISNVMEELMKKHIKRVKEGCTAKTTVKGFEALELKIQGYNGKEIADMFNVPPNSLRCWMSKARKLLEADKEVQKLLCSY